MSEILLETTEQVATITLNRPEKLNAFAGTMREQLIDILEQVSNDESARAVILTGAGRAFCAGGDVPNMVRLRGEGDVDGFSSLLDAGAAVISSIRSMAKPVIAAVNGVAAGAGCNLALACDYRIVAESASFGQTFTRIGLAPDWGGTWLLPQMVGYSRAMEMMVSGRMVPASEALATGMVQRVVPAEELGAASMELARTMASAPPLAVAAIKRLLQGPGTSALREQLSAERREQVELFLSRDAGEGLAAFLEKRKPEFEGR